ncbi:major facilitator superfamily domain-containing protein [Zychaea mexicana]|uniref:major facilitator superfamily domain-containing protein n=1 Tax=Zychaea mexicana TaxID=64656 RepID=UPI0022FE034D|nr:major facilitator superfamily domain-containing protein [Zychaea mexicana]KAI9479607.1 major facilitator superfamily domain-containing protein [Zychaea mexicana]
MSDTITAEEGLSSNVDETLPDPPQQQLEKKQSETVEPYCLYSKSKKLLICAIVSYAGLVSPFSGTIYFPALTLISEEFDITTSLVNLTVTVYMIFQALSPSFWGSLADLWGRRPVYLGTLFIFIGVCIGLAMAPTFPFLLGMRMVQAFGASSGIALGAGVIGDFTTPAERGGYYSIFTSCQMVATAIGPVIGGAIAQQLSWRWVFWVLLIVGAVGFFAVLFLLPETLRSLVGNGSGYANPTPTQWMKRRAAKGPVPPKADMSRFRQIPNVLEPFLYLRHPDVILTMIINGCYSAILYTYMTTTPTHFSTIYGLDQLEVGLCYLPYGFGCITGSYLGGRILNRDFRVVARKQGMTPEQVKKSGKLSLDFPIYRARLRSAWIPITLGQLVTVVYGWTLYAKAPLAVPLILQFIAGMSITPVFSVCQTLMIDLFPGRGASITATNNIVRSLLGAVATSTIEPGINKIGLGWMFTTLGLILLINTAILPILIKYGPKWWKQRIEQQERRATKRSDNERAHAAEVEAS